MKTLNRTNFTFGLIKKIIVGCREANKYNQSIVLNRKGKKILTIKKVRVEVLTLGKKQLKTKFLILDNNNKNIVLKLNNSNNQSFNKILGGNICHFLLMNVAYNFELTKGY